MSSSSSKLLDPETTSYKVFVTIKNRDMLDNSDGYYKKLILMVPGNMTISAFKREVEKEYSDLFPFDEPLICAKLEDEYGYALSNSSKAYELLKGGDRVIAVPSAKGHGGMDAISNASSTDENYAMVLSMVRSITIKLASIEMNC